MRAAKPARYRCRRKDDWSDRQLPWPWPRWTTFWTAKSPRAGPTAGTVSNTRMSPWPAQPTAATSWHPHQAFMPQQIQQRADRDGAGSFEFRSG
jgi:hypothetical protein